MIDTASNYRGGRGEKAVGYALAALRDQLGLTREMLFISTKAGFLQDEVKNQVGHWLRLSYLLSQAQSARVQLSSLYCLGRNKQENKAALSSGQVFCGFSCAAVLLASLNCSL